MQHFADFSNAARKSFTRMKQADLLGKGAPSNSYVDKIQVARRGQPSALPTPNYISRNDVMTMPKDNEVLVAAQRKIMEVATPTSNEYGLTLHRPTTTRNTKNVEGYSEVSSMDDLLNRYAPKTKNLRFGNLVEGSKDSVQPSFSLPVASETLSSRQWEPRVTIHTHPQGEATPSIPDMLRQYTEKTNSRDGLNQSLIIAPTAARTNTLYQVTDYNQEKPIDWKYDIAEKGKKTGSRWTTSSHRVPQKKS